MTPHISIRPMNWRSDSDLVHSWLTHPHAAFWQLTHVTLTEVERMYAEYAVGDEVDAWIGEVDSQPTFLIETYDPRRHPLAQHIRLHPDDLGMHILVAPALEDPTPGLTDRIMASVLRFCFHSGAQRVVVEPDERNHKILRKNARVGFRVLRHVDLPDKRAALSVCTRTDFAQSLVWRRLAWERADRLITAKAIGEFAHELLAEPEPTDEPETFTLTSAQATWRFTARRFQLDHWQVDPLSVSRRATAGSDEADADTSLAIQFVLDFADQLGLDGELLTTYLEELTATIAHRVRTDDPARPRSADLIHANMMDIESAMAEGHPCFVATNGRIGFSADDLATLTPESGQDVRPLWVAVPKENSQLSLSSAWDEDAAYERILGAEQYADLRDRMRQAGLTPDAHRPLPVHPWQWRERVQTTFAADVAAGRLVLLGPDADAHRPAASIRTWANVDDPQRPYVKTAIAVRNMGFVRGLSPAYMRATPAINDYVAERVRADAYLQRLGFDVLTEFAAIGYVGDVFHRNGLTGPHTRMIAGLWRESPVTRTSAAEQVMTMAALLHRDPMGHPFVVELIAASGQSPTEWVRDYIRAYMGPIVHLLCRHRLAFIPHGENVILRLRDHRVTGIFLKDIGEEVGLMDDGHAAELPAGIERIRITASAADIALGLFTDVFDGFFRFLAPILDESGLLNEPEFWQLVREQLDEYEREFPQAAASLPLRASDFERSCLNRLQLRNPLEMVSLDDTVGSLIKTGRLANPVAR